MVRCNLDVWVELKGTLPRHLSFALSNVLLVKQKLPIEIAHVNCVQVDLGRGKSYYEEMENNTKSFALLFRSA